MHPVVVTAILLLVVLMSMLDSAAGDTAEMCKTKYPFIPCRNKNLGEGWSQMGNNRCVKAFFDNKHIYQKDAENACRKFPNGHLVSIHNDVELNQVECAIHRVSTRDANYWIGAYLTEVYGFDDIPSFVWTDGSTFNYFHWAGGQPDFYLWREYCIEMIYVDGGRWNDIRCEENRPWVCAVNV